MNDTIFALSSGAVPAGVAVFRISGPATQEILASVAGSLPEPRRASLRGLRQVDGTLIDRGLVIFFPGPNSFTGEDCAEFHVHGGRAVVAAMVARLAGLPGTRAADAGEFTRRAFENGRMDLTAVEGLADLVAAETEQQRRAALRQAEGGLARLYETWRHGLTRVRGLVEADLDFDDEGDIPGSVADRAWIEAGALRKAIAAHLDDSGRGERLRRGVEVMLMGPPNAGKSSLLNALARRDVAIVTAEAGTTRDLIEIHVDLDGYPVTLVDTAGLREAEGLVEREGIRRARSRAAAADLVLWLEPADGDGTAVPPDDLGCPVWRVATKADVVPAEATDSDSKRASSLSISVVTGHGLHRLESELGAFAAGVCGKSDEPMISRARHRHHLEAGLRHLDAAIESDFLPLELRAEELRAAAEAIGRVTGKVGVEEWLGVIFAEFCVGK